jgi:hypothetical protein
VLVLRTCGGARHVAATAPSPAHPASGTTATAGPGTPAPSAAASSAAGQPGWVVVSRLASGIAVDSHRAPQSDGDLVSVLRFHAGLVHDALHVGWRDPPAGGAALPGAGPVVGPGQHARLLAAFNGGFLMGAGCLPCGMGGMEVASHVFVPVVSGMTSLVHSGSPALHYRGHDLHEDD